MVEVSRNVVAILLILVILISGFGTWSFMSRHASTSSQSAPSVTPTGDATAAVALQITPRYTDASIKLVVARRANG